MKKIAVVTDSAAGVTPQDAEKYGIHVLRMPITVDGVSLTDEIDITRTQLLDAMRNGSVVSTAQPIFGMAMQTFTKLLETHDEIIYLPMSSRLSGTYQSGLVLATEFPNRVYVIDDLMVAYPQLLLAIDARKLADEGKSAEEICTLIRTHADMGAILIPESIEYLKRGGRITPAAAALANLLKIIPVLLVKDGIIDKLGKVRTYRKAIQYGLKHLASIKDKHAYQWYLLNGGCDPEVYAETKKQLHSITGCDILDDQLHAVVLCHTGPGSIAFGYYRKLR